MAWIYQMQQYLICSMEYAQVHPSSILLIFNRVVADAGCSLGERQDTPWTGRQSVTGPTYRDRHPLTFKPTGNLESPINLRVFGLWEEAGVPGENPHRHEENMQTPHRRAPVGRWVRTQNPLAVRQQC